MSGQVIEPSATFTLAGSPGATLSGFRLMTAIDTVPTATVMPQPNVSATEKSTFIAGSAVINYLLKFQRLRFQPLTQSDVTIVAEDGRDGTLEFEGYSNVPAMRLQSDTYNISLQVQHGVGRLAILDTSVYVCPSVSMLTPDASPESGFVDAVDTVKFQQGFVAEPSLANRLKFVLEAMRTCRTNTLEDRKTAYPTNTAIEEQVVTTNETAQGDVTPLSLWYTILGNSTAELTLPILQPLMSGADEAAPINARMFSVIANIYRQPAYSFFDRIRMFSSQFQLIFIPVLDSSATKYPGYFIPLSSVWDNTKAVDASNTEVNGVTPSLGNESFNPMQQVLVRGPGPLYYNTQPASQDLASAGEAALIGAFPASDVIPENGGRVQQISAPEWLPPPVANKWIQALFVQNRVPTLSGYVPADAELKKDLDNSTALNSKVLQTWAQNEFLNLAMGSDTMSLDCPLDFTWELGKRYHVTVAPNTAMKEINGLEFYGFLGNIQHRYEIDSDQQGSGFTALLFSHVEMGNTPFRYNT